MRIILSVFLFFAGIFMLFSIGHYGGDGYEDYLTAESIVLNHNLSIDSRQGDIDELNYKKEVGIKGSDGRIYSSRGGIIVPLILSLFYYVGHMVFRFFNNVPHDFATMFFVSFSNPVISAVNCLLIFLISRKFLFSMRISFALAVIYGFTTMAPVYARTGFAEPTLTLFMLLSAYFLFEYKNSVKRKYLILAAVTIACMISVRASAVIFIPSFLVYVIWIFLEKRKSVSYWLQDALIFLVPLIALLMLTGVLNYALYGGFFNFGNKEALSLTNRIVGTARFLKFSKGSYYYLFSTGKSLLLFNLPIILSFIGLQKCSASRRKELILFILIFLSNLLFFIMTFRRGSLFAWGPRYLFPSVAFLVFLIGNFYENNKNLIGKLSIWILSISGFFIMMPCMFINQSKFYFFVKEKLCLPEYMINFIPDLSPIRGAWEMFMSRILFINKGVDIPFLYNPDPKLLSPVSASMAGYNNFDFWFLKILNLKPEYHVLVFGLTSFFIIVIALSFTCIIRNAFLSKD